MARPRRSRKREQPYVPLDVERLTGGIARTELRRGIEWSVQTVSAQRALKEYRCPGCALAVTPGTAHVVVWRNDSILGEAAAIAERRHWHPRCWKAS